MLMFADMIHMNDNDVTVNNKMLNETFKHESENNSSNLAHGFDFTVLSATWRTIPFRIKYKCEVLLRIW